MTADSLLLLLRQEYWENERARDRDTGVVVSLKHRKSCRENETDCTFRWRSRNSLVSEQRHSLFPCFLLQRNRFSVIAVCKFIYMPFIWVISHNYSVRLLKVPCGWLTLQNTGQYSYHLKRSYGMWLRIVLWKFTDESIFSIFRVEV
jgi:hypothetical protein